MKTLNVHLAQSLAVSNAKVEFLPNVIFATINLFNTTVIVSLAAQKECTLMELPALAVLVIVLNAPPPMCAQLAALTSSYSKGNAKRNALKDSQVLMENALNASRRTAVSVTLPLPLAINV